MRALEILNKIYTDNDSQLCVELPITYNDVYEAIAELEKAMKPKTCYGCKQSWEPNNQTFHKYFCEYLKIPIHGDFYCNRYKPKDNA